MSPLNLFHFKLTKIIFAEVRAEEKRGTHSLNALVRAVAVGEEEETRREREETEASFEASIL